MLKMIKAADNVKWSEIHKHWYATAIPARVELIPSRMIKKSAWVLLKAELNLQYRDFTTKLIVETKTEQFEYDVSVRKNGKVNELFNFPSGVMNVYLQPMNCLGSFTLNELSLSPVSVLERVGRMWYRVGAMIHTHSRVRRKKLGIRLYSPILNLSKSYRVLSRLRSFSSELPYSDWVNEFDRFSSTDEKRIVRVIDSWKHKPDITILVITEGAVAFDLWLKTIDSISQQLYQQANIILLPATHNDALGLQSVISDASLVISPGQRSDWGEQFELGLRGRSQSDILLTIRPGTILPVHSFFWIVATFIKNKQCDVVYADHDYIDDREQRNAPCFKPDWSPEFLRSTHYLGDYVAISVAAFIDSEALIFDDNGKLNLHDLHLRVTERMEPSRVIHIPAILSHYSGVNNGFDVCIVDVSKRRNVVAEHLLRLSIDAEVTMTDRGHYWVKYHLPEPIPKVSIIIPTRDMLKFLQPCVDSILTKSTYQNYEIIIVDNQSVEVETHMFFKHLAKYKNVRVIPFNQDFNFSAINNFAVEQTQGELVCLLNNDTEVISPDWMEIMVGHLLQQNVGVVGAKLYYADGRVQHAGDTVGPGGCANHLHSFLQHNDPGYCDRAILAQNLSAVTAACLLTHKVLYQKLNGLDEKNLCVAFNDVDYCLRVRKSGYHVVFTPRAELYHYESVSRGKDNSPEKVKRAKGEADYMRSQWADIMQHDPFYNQNLSYSRADFSLSHTPMVKKPWD